MTFSLLLIIRRLNHAYEKLKAFPQFIRDSDIQRPTEASPIKWTNNFKGY
jgi:hypothetical protein